MLPESARNLAVLACRLAAAACLVAAPAGGQGEGATPLARALAVPTARGLRADVRFLAADELRGRDTPSPGLRVAARFLAARAAQLGWQPAGDEGFLATHAWRRARVDLARTRASLVFPGGRVEELAFGTDYWFLPAGLTALELEAPLVLVGGGSPSELAQCELEGCAALAVGVREEHWEHLREEARRRGAVSLVTAPRGPAGEALAEKLARRARSEAGEHQLQTEADPLPTTYLTARGLRRLGLAQAAPGDRLAVRFREARALASAAEALQLENVAALLPGADPLLAGEVLVVTAHYDHLGVEGEHVFNGADDNASGASVLLALAEALAEHGPLERSVCLLWLAGEEHGLQGSWAWTRAPTLPAGLRPVCALNLDMVGRNAAGELYVTPSAAHPGYNRVVEVLERCAPAEGFPRLLPGDEQWDRSDHRPFAQVLGLPVASLSSGEHDDYHRPGDTWEKLDYDKLRRVTRLVLRALVELDGLPRGGWPVEAAATR